MDFQPEHKNQIPEPAQTQTQGIFSKGNTIAIFTMLSILVTMKEQLGLEAMLEYVEKYLTIMGGQNPRMKYAVKYALSLMSVEKMYHDAITKT